MMAAFGMLAAAAPLAAEIHAGDNIEINLKGVPAGEKAKVDGRYVVGETGTIRLPIADVAVVAAGLTGEQLARRIEAAYRDAGIYSAPTVVVVMGDTPAPAGAGVSIGGKVARPGPVPFRQGLTVLEALQAAGDLTEFGTRKRIFLTRGDQRHVLDLREAKFQNFPLQSGDVLVVDQRRPFEGE